MAHAEFSIVSAEPCENTQRRIDGGYVCNIHHLTGAGIKRTRLAMGNSNPANESLDDLTQELRERIKLAYKLFTREVPLDTFVGLSILRICNRGKHDDMAVPQVPRAERVASIAFARDAENLVEIEQHATAQQRAISESGIGSARRVGGSSMAAVSPLLHLPILKSEQGYALEYAVPAFPATGKARDPHVALHSLPGPEGFVEQIVGRDQLSG